MKNFFLLLALFLFLTKVSNAQNDQELVKQSFEKYKSSILTDKGEQAVDYVDSRTIGYYSEMADLIKGADSLQVNSLPLMDKLIVFTIRHRATNEEILSFDGKALLVYAIQRGMIGKNSVVSTSIGEVTVNGDFAKGQFVSKGKAISIYFHFYREEGYWKIDLTSLFPNSMMAMKKIISESGQSENEYLGMILETLTGKKPGHKIWQAIK